MSWSFVSCEGIFAYSSARTRQGLYVCTVWASSLKLRNGSSGQCRVSPHIRRTVAHPARYALSPQCHTSPLLPDIYGCGFSVLVAFVLLVVRVREPVFFVMIAVYCWLKRGGQVLVVMVAVVIVLTLVNIRA